MSVNQCRLALERLDADMVREFGPGYQNSQRYGEIFQGIGNALADSERVLVASHRAIVARACEVLHAIDRGESPINVADF